MRMPEFCCGDEPLLYWLPSHLFKNIGPIAFKFHSAVILGVFPLTYTRKITNQKNFIAALQRF